MEAKLQFSAQMCQIRFQHDIVVCGAASIRIESYIYILYTYICVLVVWNIFFFHILGIIIPTDFHMFQRVETTNQYNIDG